MINPDMKVCPSCKERESLIFSGVKRLGNEKATFKEVFCSWCGWDKVN